jgi:hypothetical protein
MFRNNDLAGAVQEHGERYRSDPVRLAVDFNASPL